MEELTDGGAAIRDVLLQETLPQQNRSYDNRGTELSAGLILPLILGLYYWSQCLAFVSSRMWSMSWWRWWSRQVSVRLAPPLAPSCRPRHCPSSRSASWTQHWQLDSTTAWLGSCTRRRWTCWSVLSAPWRRHKAKLRSILRLWTVTYRPTAGCSTRRRYLSRVCLWLVFVVKVRLFLIPASPQVKYTKIYLRDTTLISPFPMLLFGGDIDIQHRERLITLDGWMHFQVRCQPDISNRISVCRVQKHSSRRYSTEKLYFWLFQAELGD